MSLSTRRMFPGALRWSPILAREDRSLPSNAAQTLVPGVRCPFYD